MYLLDNTVRDYDWGSHEIIQHLLGMPVDGRPAAEVWMGAHPGAPSRVDGGPHDGESLVDLIAADPAGTLGPEVAAAFGDRLPYLFKFLAAGKPLSLQAHPSPAQARDGYLAEQARGLAPDDPDRNYKDDQAKPELICALTPFEALCGFAEPDVVVARLETLLDAGAPAELEILAATLAEGPASEAIAAALVSLLRPDDPDAMRTTVAETVQVAAGLTAIGDVDASIALLPRLAEDYQGDPGILVSLLCNFVVLAPGQALYLPAGNLHAYCSGAGVELMNASDNVLRGGLTSKRVDVDELLHVLDTTPLAVVPVEPTTVVPGWTAYPTAAPSFELSRIDGIVDAGGGPAIYLCTQGSATLAPVRGQDRDIARGQAYFVPADGSVTVRPHTPETVVFRAALPVAHEGATP